MRSVLLIILLTLIVGCVSQSHNIQLYGEVDQANKTVTVPAGSKGLKGELKKALSQSGWKLAVYRGPSVTEGELGMKTRIEQYDTFNTRYRLFVSSGNIAGFICTANQQPSPGIDYELSFIDNNSGSEIFTIEGYGCASGVVEKFINVLSGIDN